MSDPHENAQFFQPDMLLGVRIMVQQRHSCSSLKIGCICVSLFACVFGVVHGAPQDRLNILFIVVDDQSPFDLQVYNPSSKLQTPAISKLAADGMVFDAAYHMGAWTGGVCTPSRHMIMSGRTLWHIPNKPGRVNNPHITNPQLVPPDLPHHTLPAIFNRAGYDTMRTCKNGNSYEAANELFAVRRDGTRRGASDENGSTWHANQVLDYLQQRQASADTDPFLIYFGFSHPHDTRDGRPELLSKYGATNHTDQGSVPSANPLQPPLPPNYLPAHPFNNTHMTVRDEVAVSGVWKHRDEQTIRNELGREFACSENIDNQIQRVLDRLQSMGELDKTIIFYTADHGMAIGRHGLQGKQNLYEHTWRVPLIVKGPGVQSGSRVDGNVYLLDVLATLCDLTGVQVPETNEGISFKPVLEGKKDSVRDVLYGAYCGGAKPGIRSLRKGEWKLIKYDSPKDGVQETQLFNLAENEHELLVQHHASGVREKVGTSPTIRQRNLAKEDDYADTLAEMESLLLEEMRRLDDPYRLWNQPDDGLVEPQLRVPSPRKNKRK